jgi:mRNA deadenylase 3'-5' endonuclease subunit Ccr4
MNRDHIMHTEYLNDALGKACHTLTNMNDDGTHPGASALIRLQDYTDSDLSQLLDGSCLQNRVNLIQKKLKSLQDELLLASPSNNGALYPRYWIPIANEKDGTQQNISFTVAQFNTLARGLSSGPNSLFPTPFPSPNNFDGSYGGFTHLTHPELTLDYDTRKWRLLHVLLGGGISNEDIVGREIENNTDEYNLPFDILALEEVDEYYSFLHPLLACKQGMSSPEHPVGRYHGVFQPKPSSPCVKFGWYSDGVTLLWNPEKFDSITQVDNNLKPATARDVEDYCCDKGSFKGDAPCDNIPLYDPARLAAQNQVYVIVPLQILGTRRIIIVAATHLKAKKGYTNERIRHLQALELMYRLHKMKRSLQSYGWKDVELVILGDFNSEPEDLSVQCILQTDNYPEWNMKSSYPLDDNKLYTTWKARKDGPECRIIDYIFYSTSSEQTMLECTDILAVPEKQSVDELLPGFRYPSDHLLIAARFSVV